jgi:zinc D-Ala-D-Ala dipeptidase
MGVVKWLGSRTYAKVTAIAGATALYCCVMFLVATNAEEMPNSFVRLRDMAPHIQQDVRYGTIFNFTGTIVPGYARPECILTRAAAAAVINVDKYLREKGFALKIFDCYRPTRAVQYFQRWVADGEPSPLTRIFVPELDQRKLIDLGFVARKSSHSRGSTVDVGMVRASDAPLSTPDAAGACDGPFTTRPPETSLDFGTSFDCFSSKSALDVQGLSPKARANRLLLSYAMAKFGFKGYSREWWHFTLSPEPYPEREFDFPVK